LRTSRELLASALAWQLQERKFGGLTAATKRKLRVLARDEFPEVVNAYLTNGTRSIPIAIGLDEEFRELGHWGPRPLPLQAWMLANKAMIPSPQRYAYARQWYARDRGVTTLEEMLNVVTGDQ